jgi:hypothetical protein
MSGKVDLNINMIPAELLVGILSNLPLDKLAKMCRTETRIKNICQDEYFWHSYAESRGIKKDPSTTWKESVKKSKIKYAYRQMKAKTEMVSESEYNKDFEYGTKDGILYVIKWRSGIPFSSLVEEEYFNKTLINQVKYSRSHLTYLPQCFDSDDKGDIYMTFKFPNSKFVNDDDDMDTLLYIIFMSRAPTSFFEEQYSS